MGEHASQFKEQTAWAIYIALNFALLILSSNPSISRTRMSLPTALVGFAISLSMPYLSHLEHTRSLRPSTIICLFMSMTLVLDIFRLRTFCLLPDNRLVTCLFASVYMSKTAILIVESIEKQQLLGPGSQSLPPEATANVFNRYLFWWTNGVLWLGLKRALTADSLPCIDDAIGAACVPKMLTEALEKADPYRSNALIWAFAFLDKWELISGSLARLVCTGLTFCQPVLILQLLESVDGSDRTHATTRSAVLLAAYVVVYVGLAISFAAYEHRMCRFAITSRKKFAAVVLNRTMNCRQDSSDDLKSVCEIHRDIERTCNAFQHIHDLPFTFMEALVAVWLLARLLGLASIASVVVNVACLIAGSTLAIVSDRARDRWLKATELRLDMTSKILTVMKAIKITGLGKHMLADLREARLDESKASFPFRVYTVLLLTCSYVSTALTPVLGLGFYVILARVHDSGTLTSSTAFPALTLYFFLDQRIVTLIDGSNEINAVTQSLQRLQRHTLISEHADSREIVNASFTTFGEVTSSSHQQIDRTSYCAIAEGLTAGWSLDTEAALKSATFGIRTGVLTMIVGPRCCGKSTMLKALLGEVPIISGRILTIFKNAAFCSQVPWLGHGTIRQTIVVGSAWDSDWYSTIVRACCLQADFDQLPLGDQTLLGLSTKYLSESQQKRVALARALYARESVHVFDDPLQGLDETIEREILDQVFSTSGLLKRAGQTVIMATNSGLSTYTPIKSTHLANNLKAHHLLYADSVIYLNENGQTIQQDSYEAPAIRHCQNSPGMKPKDHQATNGVTSASLQRPTVSPDVQWERGHKPETGDLEACLLYIRSVGMPVLLLLLVCTISFVLSFILQQVWLNWWTLSNKARPNQDIGFWLGIYGALGCFALFLTFLVHWLFSVILAPRTAHRFCENLLEALLRYAHCRLNSREISSSKQDDHSTTPGLTCPLERENAMNRWDSLHTHKLNQDLGLIDGALPETFELTLYTILSVLGESILIFIGSSFILATVVPVVLLYVFYIGKCYVRTARQLRILDNQAKADLLSHHEDLVSGNMIIRAYGWLKHYQCQSTLALNASQRVLYTLGCTQRWLSVTLDLTVAGIATLIVAVALLSTDGQGSRMLGVSLFNLVGFSGTLHVFIKQWNTLDANIGAVSRIWTYVRDTKADNLGVDAQTISPLWPSRGVIHISSVTASWVHSINPVLHDISLTICAGEKVALCGEAGSGKSSLLSAILQVLDLNQGFIEIDGIDSSRLSREVLRSRLNTIPCDTVWLRGTWRRNTNPEGNASDETIVAALNAVGLWSIITSQGGLDACVEENIFSVGQQRLFRVARALCRPSNIILIDESPSSTDVETDAIVLDTIRTYFEGRTVLAVAYNVDNILDFDKIAFMAHGRIIEFDTPKALLSREGGAFRSMFETIRRRPL
ncbi:hypothetical protein N7539_007176 [Penicillium diatomitis]|uniref:Uncharacterized protein n=1 Tax=Penicillium diatomitis TaxID=2819901 RepID=A0A9W9WV23_9EURO|nr:uncharacterized protein N7539_007176 [Penicillium diatomitis]KAJ5477032.1 hypothetical protein N7539_007176 [Penicillium diatomitis]